MQVSILHAKYPYVYEPNDQDDDAQLQTQLGEKREREREVTVAIRTGIIAVHHRGGLSWDLGSSLSISMYVGLTDFA